MKHGDKVKIKILQAGLQQWRVSYRNVTARNIAKTLGLTHAAVLYHFPEGVEQAVAKYAVEQKDKTVIRQLITSNHPAVSEFSTGEKFYWLNTIDDHA